MSKLDPYSYMGKNPDTVTLTFEDKELDIKFDLILRKYSSLRILKANDLAEELIDKYIVQGHPLQPIRLPNGTYDTVELSKDAVRVIALIQHAQSGPDSDKYSFEELAHFAALSSSIVNQYANAGEYIKPEVNFTEAEAEVQDSPQSKE